MRGCVLFFLILASIVFAGEQPAVEPPRPPKAESEWSLRDKRDFRLPTPEVRELKPWYETNVERFNGGCYLNGQQTKEQYLRLSEKTPHAVRWELTVAPGWQAGGEKAWQFIEEGFYIANRDPRSPEKLSLNREYKLALERDGEELRFFVDNRLHTTLKVPAADRTPLMAASETADLLIYDSFLYFKAGEKLSDPPPPPAAVKQPAPQWQVVYRDDFNDAECVKRYQKYQNGEIGWNEKYKALLLSAQNTDVYAGVRKSLPGDLRVRFRALRRKSAEQLGIGLMFNLDGSLRTENGYFAEWARGIAQIKKRNHIQKLVDAPTPQTDDRWLSIELKRVGPAITMSMQDKVVLEWVDPHPFTGSKHDLLTFYIWSDSTIIDDLVIECNANDPTAPMGDDPATLDNMTKASRPVLDQPGMGDF